MVLRRALGIPGATMMGLGSILGTGVFVSYAVAAGIAGPAVIVATALAALVATCNALSSAQLAAAYPVSGGSYEYGYRLLSPTLGFFAGWMFLCAKSASAATASLGLAGYGLNLFGVGARFPLTPFAVGAVFVLTAIAAAGITRSSRFNLLMVGATLFALLVFVAGVAPLALQHGRANLVPFFRSDAAAETSAIRNVLHATALMFVAYAGYGRIATLGEEVRQPERNIPRAIILTLVVSSLVYVSVALVSVSAAGVALLDQATRATAAPLEVVAREFGLPGVHWVVAGGALTAMIGVLLNLILGLSRVLLAMARRGDAPAVLAKVRPGSSSPAAAVWVTGLTIAGLALIGNVRTTWSFSAFTVLVYYAITNLAALRLPPEKRRYSRAWAWGGLGSCLFLACWVDWQVWLAGLVLLAAGLLARTAMQNWWPGRPAT